MATITETAIANLALSKLGISPVIVVGEDTKRGKVTELWYERTRDAVLRMHPWSFAKVRKELAPLASAPEWGYDYQYQLPTTPKCLWVWKAYESQFRTFTIRSGARKPLYEVEGDRILTDFDELHIVYISQVTDVTKFDSLFILALASYLAHEMCFDLTGSRGDESRLLQQTEFHLARASGKSQEENWHEPDENSTWVDVGHSERRFGIEDFRYRF